MADVETEREMSRAEVAAYLHRFADRFGGTGANGSNRTHDDGETSDDPENADADSVDADRTDPDSAEAFVEEGTDNADDETRARGGSVTFTVGGESATVNPPETVQFRLAVDSTSGMLESGDHETVTFTLDWDSEPPADDDTLDIR